MIGLESMRIALQGIMHNLMRSALTMLGMLIGVGSVIMLVAVGTGSSQAVHPPTPAYPRCYGHFNPSVVSTPPCTTKKLG